MVREYIPEGGIHALWAGCLKTDGLCFFNQELRDVLSLNRFMIPDISYLGKSIYPKIFQRPCVIPPILTGSKELK